MESTEVSSEEENEDEYEKLGWTIGKADRYIKNKEYHKFNDLLKYMSDDSEGV